MFIDYNTAVLRIPAGDLIQLLLPSFTSSAKAQAKKEARLLAEANLRQRRLNALVDIISRLTTTLERGELLTRIMNHARDLLEVEATSVWELDEQADPPVLRLHVATGDRGERLAEVTVPKQALIRSPGSAVPITSFTRML